MILQKFRLGSMCDAGRTLYRQISFKAAEWKGIFAGILIPECFSSFQRKERKKKRWGKNHRQVSFKAANGRFPEATRRAGNPPASFLDSFLSLPELSAQTPLYFGTQDLTDTAGHCRAPAGPGLGDHVGPQL